MDSYVAKKGGVQFFVQPDMIEAYSKAGYEIAKFQEVKVENVKEEIQKISAEKGENGNGY